MRQAQQTSEIAETSQAESFPLGLVLRGEKTTYRANEFIRDPQMYTDKARWYQCYLFLKTRRGRDEKNREIYYCQKFILYDDGSFRGSGGDRMPDSLLIKKIEQGDLSYLKDTKEDVEEFEIIAARIRKWLTKNKKLCTIPMPKPVRT